MANCTRSRKESFRSIDSETNLEMSRQRSMMVVFFTFPGATACSASNAAARGAGAPKGLTQ
jgi:hypothetical protein